MIFVKIESFKELTQGYMGIREPVSSDEADIKEGFMCMPGMVFDNECNRIGYGGGFYDRYLSSFTKRDTVMAVGVGYDFQLLSSMTFEDEYDVPLDGVITDKREVFIDDWFR